MAGFLYGAWGLVIAALVLRGLAGLADDGASSVLVVGAAFIAFAGTIALIDLHERS